MSEATSTSADQETLARGIQRMPDPRVWGTTIGAAGATVFVFANRGELPDPWPVVAVVAWAVACVAYLAFVFAVPRVFPAPPEVRRTAGLVYLVSVIGMVTVIRLGFLVLDDAGRPELGPALIALAVGAHFLPFAAAFAYPMFMRLGVVMMAIGFAGLALGWTVDGTLAAWAAVLTGLAMLAVIATDAAAARPAAREV